MRLVTTTTTTRATRTADDVSAATKKHMRSKVVVISVVILISQFCYMVMIEPFEFFPNAKGIARSIATTSWGNIIVDGDDAYNILVRQSAAGSAASSRSRWSQYPEITYTNLQWFHPSEKIAEHSPRSLGMKNFMEAVMAHARFNASLWSDVEQNPNRTEPVLAFLDADACHDVHWPNFGGDHNLSYDKENGVRHAGWSYVGFPNICAIIDRALESPVFTASPHSKLVVLSCSTDEGGKVGWGQDCLAPHRNATRYKQLVVGHQTKPVHLINSQDFGFSALPVKTVDVARDGLCNISSLEFLMAYKGRARNHFYDFPMAMKEIMKTRSDVYVEFGFQHYIDSTHPKGIHGQSVIAPTPKELQANDTYYHLMTHSKFCLTGRGDNIYSVRFPEVLSAGCIPILYADGWVMPYTRSVVDWTKIAVIIPQRHVRQTLNYIEDMSDEEICERRLRAYDVYHTYIKDGRGRLDAILEIMDRRLRTGRIEPYQYAPGVSTHKDSIEYIKEKLEI